jgi:prepilin-type N-terminal cleavage/methylation domain-containing protein
MRTLRRQEGFTLIELLVVLALFIVVMAATLTVLGAYSNGEQGSLQRDDAQDQARLAIDQIIHQVRNIASPFTAPKLLERATPYDIEFQTVGVPSQFPGGSCGSNTSCVERVRYCIPNDTNPGSPSDEVMYQETQTWTSSTVPSDPWSSDPSVTIACPDSPLPSGVSAAVVAATGITNRYQGRIDRCAFLFNNTCAGVQASNLSTIFTLQVDLFVDPTPTVQHTCGPTSGSIVNACETELRSSAFLRNQPRAPVAQFTWTPTGGGGVLLNGGISYSPDGQDLSFSWSCTLPSPCSQSAALAGSQSGLVDWQPGAGTYTVVLTVTDQTGLVSSSQPVQVTVT